MKKNTLSLVLMLITLAVINSCSSCKKETTPTNDNPWGLPNATQEGKNTLGFLLNGQPWTPQGNNGTANLSIDIDFGYKNGILGIVAYRTLSSTDKTQFIIGVIDSLNYKTAPFSLSVQKNSLGGLSFSTKSYCDILHSDTTIYQSGNISISKLDKTNRIIAGTFEGIIYKQECVDTLKITNGRFDLKY